MEDRPQPLIVRSGAGAKYEQGPATFKTQGLSQPGRFDFFEMAIEYCTGPGVHIHDHQDDTFYVLSGVLSVQCWGEISELESGDFISIPPGVPHTFDNLDQEQGPVRVINLMTPGGYEGIFAANESSQTRSEIEQTNIDRSFGVTYVGPTLGAQLGLTVSADG